ncbi:MAG TPA: ATP-binding protein [Candidatus Paceibacterota bacterium]|nr:ATP-binding protein [Candidatus Paceibacterota bacterium]
MNELAARVRSLYGPREWRIAAALFVSYVVTYWLAAQVLPPDARFNPASAIALSTLYFGGRRLWPIVYIAALFSNILTSTPVLGLIFLPVFEILQAVAGSWFLHWAHIDPLFRRYRDTFYFLASVILISFITPTLSLIIRAWRHLPDLLVTWWHAYIAMLFCFLVLTPFLLRWFTKPRFSRTPMEIAEICGIFVLLLGLDLLIFVRTIPFVFGVPLLDLLFIPLFWIALKHRPRFITLALVLTSIIAITSVALKAPPALATVYLFQTEIMMITLGIAFFIITSLEEDRRVNTNVMHSQMATLRNAIARESSESKAKNDFIAILSHELRNPLAPVLSSIDLMKLKGPRDQEDMELLKIMEDRMDTVRRLLDDLLDISRISEGKVALKREQVALEPIIKRAVLSTEHHRKELHQRLVLRLLETPAKVVGDSVRLEQVFSNLLTNASKYSASGDTIVLAMRTQGSFVEVEVADRGIGLQPGELESIFLPFHQVNQDERKKGLGIGLTLVRNFVQLHGGTIEAKSEGRGQGSRFIVRLPLVESVPAASHKPHYFRNEIRKGGGKRSPSVLIIDDNDAAAGGIGRLLEFHGCRVAYAYDGGQGITKARSISPDVIFLDIGLPDQDGHDVARLLRSEGYKGKIIALTGYNMNTSDDKESKKYFDHYLVKPVSLTDLQRVLADPL